MPTTNPYARPRWRAAQSNVRQIAGAAVTRGRAVRELRVSAPGEAADATGCRVELVARPSSRSVRSGHPASLPCWLRPRQRFSSSPGVGRATDERPVTSPDSSTTMSGYRARDAVPIGARTIGTTLPRCLVGCAQGSGLPQSVALRSRMISPRRRTLRATRTKAQMLDFGFRLRPARVWAHRVRCATVLECVRSRPGTSRAP
jgi:hypothetical protein